MLIAFALAGMMSLSKAERDFYFEKPPQNTLHDCGTAPEPYGDCRLPPGLTAQDVEAKLAGKSTAWWREGDQFVVVAKRDTDQAYLCCAARGRMDHIDGDLWALRLRIVDLDHATINVSVRPQPDQAEDIFRGPLAPPAPQAVKTLQGTAHIEHIASKYLDAPRDVVIYTPPSFDVAKKYPVVYLADGNSRLDMLGIIDPLIARGELPPMVLVEIFNAPSDEMRSEEYLYGWHNGGGNFRKHEMFVLNEVLPLAEQKYGASSDPKDRIVTGSSSGAAWAISMGLRHSDIFPTVIAQSLVWNGGDISKTRFSGGTFTSSNGEGGFTEGLSDTKTRFFLTAGTLEPWFYEETRHFADEARSAGHDVQLETTVSGHAAVIWPPLLIDGLKWALQR